MKKAKFVFNIVGMMIFNICSVIGFLSLLKVENTLSYWIASVVIGLLTIVAYRNEISNEFGTNQNIRGKL
ncbi:hypothetical protein CPS91_004355 [Salmonella enterica subsp. enterica]|nr:hypothetical protein [Salmonella enterica subsp. enterica]EDN7307227.1 hypothetical protein [Salmonella enterica subsp. enterica]EDQ3366021.1 hypothetical protein [Salmonella enterica subsp. enterica]EDR5096816.1 hypothetical protein [Salmonella enterica subsp. enterica]EDS2029704.1 hypothetical protein [Salmonella enterica subsp. enterica]